MHVWIISSAQLTHEQTNTVKKDHYFFVVKTPKIKFYEIRRKKPEILGSKCTTIFWGLLTLKIDFGTLKNWKNISNLIPVKY